MKTTVPLIMSLRKLSLLLLAVYFTLTSTAQTYTTKANGAWSSPSTWQNGLVPLATNILPTAVINIKHIVTYSGGNIVNLGTINISNPNGVSPRLIVPAGVNITNGLTGRITIVNGELRQYRFAGGGESGTNQMGDFRNTGGNVTIKNSFVEIAQNWTNEQSGRVVMKNSSLAIGKAYQLISQAIDTIENSSVSVGMHGVGDFYCDGQSSTFTSLRVEVASSSGRFELKGGAISGTIDHISMKNHLTNTYSDDKIVANSSVVTTGIFLNSYAIGDQSNYKPNGKFTGPQTFDCSLSYFPAGLYDTDNQTALNFSTTPVLVSGTDLAVGALYKYEGVAPGMDAYVRIDSLKNGATITKIDDNTGGLGYIEGFQPEIRNGPSSGMSYAVFTVNYKVTGSSIGHEMGTFSITAVDIDGGSTMKEFNEIGMGPGATASYMVNPSDIAMTQVNPGTYRGLNVAGIEKGGIDTAAKTNMFTVTNSKVSTFTLKLGSIKTNSSQTARQYGIFMKGFVYSNLVVSLPVKLISFTATLNNAQNKVDLKWATASEQNASHFVVERSFDGVNFEEAGLVFAYGNTNERKDYSLPDNLANVNKTIIYYRLRSVDTDGKTEYSEVRIVRIGKKEESLAMVVYPNPVVNELRVTLPSSWQGKAVNFSIFNARGQRVKGLSAGSASQTETIQVSDLQRGLYILSASFGQETIQQKIIKN